MRRRIPSTRMMTAFEAAVRHESFSRAAADLNLTQGAVSRQVQALEAFLGTELFRRANGRLTLTASGRRLGQQIAPMLDSLETLMDTMRRLGGRGAPIVIAAYPTFASRWLIGRILAYEASTSSAPLRIETVASNADFDPDRVDFGILQGEPPFPGLRNELLMPEALVVACAPALAEDIRNAGGDLLSVPYLRQITRPLALRIWSETMGLPIADFAAGRQFERYDMMIEAAMEGHGFGVFPEILIQRELRSGQLVLAHPHVAVPAAAYHVVTPDNRELRTEADALRRWLLASARYAE